MDRLEAMQVFVRVAELGSFSRAAEQLGRPKASISSTVQQLEAHLGTRLLHRTTRRVQMTQDGQTYYERCQDLLSDVEELESLFQQTPATLSGRLRIDMSVGIARNLVIPKLPEFLQQHPGITIELSSTDRLVDIVREGFDCVIRTGTLTDSGLIARPLGYMHIINCVSPAYIARYGEPKTLKQLSKHRLIHYTTTLGSKPYGWEYWDGSAYRCIEMQGALTVNTGAAYVSACLAGLGLIQVPAIGVKELLEDGSLIEVLKDYRAEPMPVSLIYPNRRHLSRRLQVFMDWLTELTQIYLA